MLLRLKLQRPIPLVLVVSEVCFPGMSQPIFRPLNLLTEVRCWFRTFRNSGSTPAADLRDQVSVKDIIYFTATSQ